MRLVGTLDHESSARRIAAYLKNKGIDSSCEVSFDAGTGLMTYRLWVIDEDRLNEATFDFEQFQKEPSNAEFDAPVVLKSAAEEARTPNEGQPLRFAKRGTPVTFSLLILCALIFFYNAVEMLPLRKEGLTGAFLLTPIQI